MISIKYDGSINFPCPVALFKSREKAVIRIALLIEYENERRKNFLKEVDFYEDREYSNECR